MSDHALSQVEDRLAVILSAYGALSGQTVIVSQSIDLAIDEISLPALAITTTSYSFEVADENWATVHTAGIEIEAITATPATGSISRANRNTLANVLAAIAANRSLGIGIEDIQEDDIAPVEPRGKDVDGASLKFIVTFRTSRNDWTTILA